MKNSLITIIVTNLVLYGISETLAQTLLCYYPNAPRFLVQIHDSTHSVSFNSNDIRIRTGTATDEADEEIEETTFNRFLDYLNTEQDPEPPLPLLTDDDDADRHLTYYQFNRLAGFMCWGFILAFAQCWWYKLLQIYSYHPQLVEVLRKVLSDQLVYSPVSLFCFFVYGTMVLESGTWEDAKAKLRKVYLKTLVINYLVWFPVQFVNFLLVPRNFQVPFSSSVSVLWNCFLSMRNSSA